MKKEVESGNMQFCYTFAFCSLQMLFGVLLTRSTSWPPVPKVPLQQLFLPGWAWLCISVMVFPQGGQLGVLPR